MGVMNEPSAGDYANSAAQATALTVQDAFVLIGWLSDRVAYLENQFNIGSGDPIPELPSQMHGFACYPKRERAVKDALEAMGRA